MPADDGPVFREPWEARAFALAVAWVFAYPVNRYMIARGRGNWLIWYYFLMFAASIGQLGGIDPGVEPPMSAWCPREPT